MALKSFGGSIILKIVYGYKLKTKDDPYLDLMHKAVGGIVLAMNHGSFWVDYMPILKYVPGKLHSFSSAYERILCSPLSKRGPPELSSRGRLQYGSRM